MRTNDTRIIDLQFAVKLIVKGNRKYLLFIETHINSNYTYRSVEYRRYLNIIKNIYYEDSNY